MDEARASSDSDIARISRTDTTSPSTWIGTPRRGCCSRCRWAPDLAIFPDLRYGCPRLRTRGYAVDWADWPLHAIDVGIYLHMLLAPTTSQLGVEFSVELDVFVVGMHLGHRCNVELSASCGLPSCCGIDEALRTLWPMENALTVERGRLWLALKIYCVPTRRASGVSASGGPVLRSIVALGRMRLIGFPAGSDLRGISCAAALLHLILSRLIIPTLETKHLYYSLLSAALSFGGFTSIS
ncbi:hypothetical protein B0H10DRAFT_278530 [Mycena sp. CBHHK59/15]|nr:hypothetical protein B0H10DRAFT_278530 [Mycena sp. CBHHK59/15]